MVPAGHSTVSFQPNYQGGGDCWGPSAKASADGAQRTPNLLNIRTGLAGMYYLRHEFDTGAGNPLGLGPKGNARQLITSCIPSRPRYRPPETPTARFR